MSVFIDSLLFDSGLDIFDKKLDGFKKYQKRINSKSRITCNIESTKKEILFLKDDIILETDGTFSFKPDDFFNPELSKVNEHFVLDQELKYILAEYESPLKIGDNLKQAVITLNTKEAYRENGKYSFMISVPGLKSEDKIKDSLEIYEIKVELTGRTLWQKIWEK